MKPAGKSPLQHLVDEQTTQILATSLDQQMFHVADEVQLQEGCQCDIDGAEIEVEPVDGPVIHAVHDVLFNNPSTLTIRKHHATPNAILEKFADFWRDRWWRRTLPSTSDWERMFAFAEQYLPRKAMKRTTIPEECWIETNKRYAAKAARGPDGVDRRDLQSLHP